MQIRWLDTIAVDQRSPRFPWWAHALDLVAVVSALACVALFFKTGPRFWLGSSFISLRTPWRALACAVIAAGVRHLLLRRPALPQRLAAGVRALVRSESLRAALAPFAASRGAVLLAAYLALLTVGYATDRPRPRFSDNEFLNLVTKWDGEWYYNIASDGYRWDDSLHNRARLAFFPAFPMLMRVAGWLAGNLIVGGLLVSLAAFLWALTYLFRLAREDIGEADALAAVALLAFYPFSVFYGTIYTESLFLLSAVGGLYHFRRSEWVKASAWGLLAGLTRPNGFLLSAVLAAVVAERLYREHRRVTPPGASDWKPVAAALLVACTPVVGMGLYCAFSWSQSGDPLMWMRLHEFWGRGDHSLWEMLGDRYRLIADRGFIGYVIDGPIDAVNLAAAIFAIGAAWPVLRRLGLAYALFVVINVVPPLLSGTTLSLARLTSTLFPLFVWLALSVRGEKRTAMIGSFAVLQGFFAVLFFTWRRFY